MTDQKQDKQKNIIEQIEDTANQLNLKDIDWRRQPSQTDMEYLVDHAPFLQIIDMSATPTIEQEVKILKAATNWNIHYYGDAMSSSLGLFLYGGGDFRFRFPDSDDDDEGGGAAGGILNPGQGTFRNQSVLTAGEMISLAKKWGWKGARIIDGHPLMKWGAWLKAAEIDLPLTGYAPDQRAKEKNKRLQRSREELHLVTGFRRRG